MMRILPINISEIKPQDLHKIAPRADFDISDAVLKVAPLVSAVKNEGIKAIIDQSKLFDGGVAENILMSKKDRFAALSNLDPKVKKALETAIDRVSLASKAAVPENKITNIDNGAKIYQRWQAVNRVGLYVPGGKAVYPSSVVMNVVAAKIAGVKEIVLVSPPQREFNFMVHPTILAAAELLEVNEVYAMGGAGAIAAMAYGVSELNLMPVDVITGPGNIFVAAAKRIVNGVVGIDSEAGTTEIAILADESAKPDLIAADLISQAEHDEMAAAVLITTSNDLANSVNFEIQEQIKTTANYDRVVQALQGKQSGIFVVENLEAAIVFSNIYAAEHLEIHMSDAHSIANLCTNAGAIFLGDYSPVSLGDYAAGSNHVLPTGGTARFSSGLGPYSFLRSQQIIDYSAGALKKISDDVIVLSDAEGLGAHGDAIKIRAKYF